MADRRPQHPIRIRGNLGVFDAPGTPTVFGLYLTPVYPYGYTVTEPVSGFKVASGSTPLDALRALRLRAQDLRSEHGSFRAALDVARREAVICEASAAARTTLDLIRETLAGTPGTPTTDTQDAAA